MCISIYIYIYIPEVDGGGDRDREGDRETERQRDRETERYVMLYCIIAKYVMVWYGIVWYSEYRERGESERRGGATRPRLTTALYYERLEYNRI